ncbi:unannotated protein [freshwater metagenome]|uniref:Unannotated protein n=1 Tax=freshwater metagenome TaxID=449393 RepID=A0A6J6QXP7_9ZZZZ|nr:hypothetical protein [Actinomycetota bacterium]MSW25685.1 hypothetical protein [Actinomycetota bacterium]MSW33417.1 hypothetical protein [Actinomycetota bacterium]MSX30441.1 hypothetical protein [Actinomycetota bacterium]MSX51327.1 hypothetical protein [Actinomycetota bacterium]
MKVNINDPMARSVTGSDSEWRDACEAAGSSIQSLSQFRRWPVFVFHVEGTPRIGGELLAQRLLRNPMFTKSLPTISKTEEFGSPLNLISIPFESKTFKLSPTTLRYSNNCLNAIALFGLQIFQNQIIEIGGGYGGECKVFNDISRSITKEDKDLNWTVYDLPSSTALIRKWVEFSSYKVQFGSIYAEPKKISHDSMIISNGAISEMRDELLEDYFTNLILPAKYGYFITNFETHSSPYGGWTTEMFLNRLIAAGKKDAKVLPSHKYLSFTDSGNSTLVVFGMDDQRPPKNRLGDPIRYKAISSSQQMTSRLEKWIIKAAFLDSSLGVLLEFLERILLRDKYRKLYKRK